ncbi:ATP-dependent Clp protease proteolytic subunit [Bdellovibrionota bacterium FG-2]
MENHFFTPMDQALLDRRMIMMSGEVHSKLAKEVNKALLALDNLDSKKPIYLLINSPGGEINSGFSIYDTARFINAEVKTVVIGLAASMGSLIALCAKKKNRLAFPNSKFLIHQPLVSGTLQGQASDLAIHAKDIVKTKLKINQLYAKETGRPLEEIVKATDRDNWLDVEEALQFGLISRIISKFSEL